MKTYRAITMPPHINDGWSSELQATDAEEALQEFRRSSNITMLDVQVKNGSGWKYVLDTGWVVTNTRESIVCTYWTIAKGDKEYRVVTYPKSDLIAVYTKTETGHRPVSKLQGRKIIPELRFAIARARGQIDD